MAERPHGAIYLRSPPNAERRIGPVARGLEPRGGANTDVQAHLQDRKDANAKWFAENHDPASCPNVVRQSAMRVLCHRAPSTSVQPV